MEIRAYKPGDVIKPLINKSVKDIEPAHYSKEQQRHLEEVIPDMNLEFAGKNRYLYFVALEDGKIVGVAGFQKESGTVAGIFVDPDLKGLGIGSKLKRRMEEKARERDLEELETLASLEATEFYRKNGYEVTGERKQDIEGMDIALKVMTKKL